MLLLELIKCLVARPRRLERARNPGDERKLPRAATKVPISPTRCEERLASVAYLRYF